MSKNDFQATKIVFRQAVEWKIEKNEKPFNAFGVALRSLWLKL